MGPSYDKDLEYLLSAIPFHAFDKLSARKIASGARGTVYAANWHRPESAKEEGYEIIPVALKSVAVSSQPEAHLDERRLVKEVRSRYPIEKPSQTYEIFIASKRYFNAAAEGRRRDPIIWSHKIP